MPVPATISPAPPMPPEDLANLTSDKLRAMLSKSLERTARELTRLAWIVRILEERGEDLSDLRIGLLAYLRQIAYGQVLPEVVVRFGSSPGLLREIASLPTPEQTKLAAGESVLLVVREGNQVTHRMADPLRMTPAQRRQVFGPGRLRDEAEQILRLKEQSEDPVPAKAKPKGKITIDPQRRGIVVNRTLVPTPLVVELLAELGATPETDDPTDEQVNCKLTDAEIYALRRHSIDSDLSMNLLIRRALRAAGLLTGYRRGE